PDPTRYIPPATRPYQVYTTCNQTLPGIYHLQPDPTRYIPPVTRPYQVYTTCNQTLPDVYHL
ncbi:predicted protein, partial [Nematostella vectensis]